MSSNNPLKTTKKHLTMKSRKPRQTQTSSSNKKIKRHQLKTPMMMKSSKSLSLTSFERGGSGKGSLETITVKKKCS
jgi:hypothetical protein